MIISIQINATKKAYHYRHMPLSNLLQQILLQTDPTNCFGVKKIKKAKTQCAGILPLSKCHVLKKLRVAIDRFRCGFLHNYNSWHCYAACPPKTWNTLYISHSHYNCYLAALIGMSFCYWPAHLLCLGSMKVPEAFYRHRLFHLGWSQK